MGPSLESLQLDESGPRQGMEGSWEMTRELVPPHVLSLEKEGEDWRVNVRVVNSMGCTLKKTESGFSAGMVMATEMMPPPHLMALEDEMMQLIESITDIAREGELLKVTAGDKSEMFRAVSEKKGAATKDQVNWMNQ